MPIAGTAILLPEASPLNSIRRAVRLLPSVQGLAEQWRICLSNLEVKRKIHAQLGEEIAALLDGGQANKQELTEYSAPTEVDEQPSVEQA